HKAHAAQVDPQDGNMAGVGALGRVENGAVPAEADEHIRAPELGLHIAETDVLGKLHPVALQSKGEAHHRLYPNIPQNLIRRLGGLQSPIPVGIRAQYYLHCPLSSNASWDCRTSPARSPCQGSPAPTRRWPRYSIFPSGPRMGE